ncbi:MAG: TAXI family TRAP transporter solute-binding subunit, partial [Desulfobacteraceae bacterium]|nr:TAXI family TRAP transporter solute-binding subunit [Desulfobacteraceae bacterium]
MRKRSILNVIACICLGLMIVAFPFGRAHAGPEKPQSLRLAANVVGSLMYAIGGGLAGVIEKNSSLKVEVLPQGNVVAYPMFTTRECDLIISATDEANMAYLGLVVYGKMTRGKGFDMRMLMVGNPLQAGLLVAKDSGIRTAEDLKGKKVTTDFGTLHALTLGVRAYLIGLGLTQKDVIPVKTTNVPAAMRLVLEGKADACYGAIGVPAFRELQAARGAQYIGLPSDPQRWKGIRRVFHGYFPAKVKPSKVAVGVDKPMILLGKNFTLISRAGLSDETAYT